MEAYYPGPEGRSCHGEHVAEEEPTQDVRGFYLCTHILTDGCRCGAPVPIGKWKRNGGCCLNHGEAVPARNA